MVGNNALERGLASVLAADPSICSTRRGLLIAPLVAGLPFAMLDASARAGPIDPAETAITPPDAIKWSDWMRIPAAQRRDGAALRWLGQAWALLSIDEVVPRLHERPTYLRY